MMVISGTTTEHSIAASDTNGFGAGADIEWVYDDSTGLFEPNTDLQTLLDDTTEGPWRVVSVSAITRRGGGGNAAPNAAANGQYLAHIRFDADSNITFPGLPGAFSNVAGDRIIATRAGTQIIHSSAGSDSIYPADRCTWRTSPDGARGYQIDQAMFYSGNAAGSAILNPRLGYIGKSGRFVEIAN